MSLARKLHVVLAIALVITIGTGCSTFDPKTSAAGVKVKTHEFNGIEFVWMPPGAFEMGSPEHEVGRDADEGPVHAVTFDKGFWISRPGAGVPDTADASGDAGLGDAPVR